MQCTGNLQAPFERRNHFSTDQHAEYSVFVELLWLTFQALVLSLKGELKTSYAHNPLWEVLHTSAVVGERDNNRLSSGNIPVLVGKLQLVICYLSG